MKITQRHTFPLCLLGCWIFTQARAGIVLPPRNVSALWVSDFTPGLRWSPPLQPDANCSYRVAATTKSLFTNEVDVSPAFFSLLVMEGGSIHWNVTRVCNGSPGEPRVLSISYPELVKDLACFLDSPRRARCQWSPGAPPADFRLYYKLVDECGVDSAPPALRECPSYVWTGGVASGCELPATVCHVAYVLVNGTVDGEPVRNTFRRQLADDVRLPPLEWRAEKMGNKLNVSWERPEVAVPDGWRIQINYTECGGARESLEIEGEVWSHPLVLDSGCPRAVAVRATSQSGATPWGEWRRFDADASPLLYMVAVVLVSVAALVALACVCLGRNKDVIFRKVPEPFDYVSEIYNNNTQSVFHGLYISPEEEECKISLVVDEQLDGTTC